MKFKKLTVLALMACLVFTGCGKGSSEENEVRNEDPVAQEFVLFLFHIASPHRRSRMRGAM